MCVCLIGCPSSQTLRIKGTKISVAPRVCRASITKATATQSPQTVTIPQWLIFPREAKTLHFNMKSYFLNISTTNQALAHTSTQGWHSDASPAQAVFSPQLHTSVPHPQKKQKHKTKNKQTKENNPFFNGIVCFFGC